MQLNLNILRHIADGVGVVIGCHAPSESQTLTVLVILGQDRYDTCNKVSTAECWNGLRSF